MRRIQRVLSRRLDVCLVDPTLCVPICVSARVLWYPLCTRGNYFWKRALSPEVKGRKNYGVYRPLRLASLPLFLRLALLRRISLRDPGGVEKFRVRWRAALKLESIKVNCVARYQILIILIFATAKGREYCRGDESPPICMRDMFHVAIHWARPQPQLPVLDLTIKRQNDPSSFNLTILINRSQTKNIKIINKFHKEFSFVHFLNGRKIEHQDIYDFNVES